MMCSGAIVFFDSCSHISFASDEIKWINSEEDARVVKRVSVSWHDLFTYTTLDDQIPCLLCTRNIIWK